MTANNWTQNLPTARRGWYWYIPRLDAPLPYDIYDVSVVGHVIEIWDGENGWVPAEDFGCEGGWWCGPLQPPALPDGPGPVAEQLNQS